MRVRHDDHRQAHRAHLGQGRGARSTDDEVGGAQRGQHLVAQERVRAVAPTDRLRKALATGQGHRIALVAGHVDDRHPLDQAPQRLGHRRVEPADGLRPAEDEQHPFAGADIHACPGRLAVDRADVADRGPRHVTRATRGGRRQSSTRGVERDRQRVSQPRRGTDRPARDDVAVPHHDRDAQWGSRQQDRHGHVPAGREDRGRPLADEDGGCLRDGDGKSDRVEDGVDVGLGRAQGAS